MRDQRGLHIERRHPESGHLEHVVVAAAVAIHAVRIAHVDVAGVRPLAREGAARLLALVPVALRRARAAHQQLAQLAVGDVRALVVDDAQVVAGHRDAGRAVAQLAGLVRDEDVQHLGRAEAVEDVDAEALLPFRADMLGQRLGGGDAPAQALRSVLRRAGGIGEHHGVERRRAEEQRRLLAPQHFEDRGRRRAVRQQRGRRADRHRKAHAVAEPVGVIELAGREAHVVLGDAEHGLRIILRGRHRARMHMPHAFRHAGRAGRIEPERDLVGAGLGGSRGAFGVQQRGKIRMLARSRRRPRSASSVSKSPRRRSPRS